VDVPGDHAAPASTALNVVNPARSRNTARPSHGDQRNVLAVRMIVDLIQEV
jgi:hypothetical protein